MNQADLNILTNTPYDYKVLLSCGHYVWMRNEPMGKTTKFACRQNMGCGYRLNWLESQDMNKERIIYNV